MSSALDLSAHADEIASTHKRILCSDPSIAWALYGFDRSGSALLVQAQGSGGLDELAEEFDDGKVQFAFARVEDPNTRLSKFVFVSWCGQGVPVSRKGLVGSQVGQVQRVLGGYHVAVVARSEEDVRPAEIMEQVGRSSGAQYSIHTQPKRQPPPVTAAKPVLGAGTAFRKGGSYGAPTVSKGAAWEAAAAAAVISPPAISPARPSYAQSPPVSATSSIGGTRPLYGAGTAAGGSRPASSIHGARNPAYGAGASRQSGYSPGPASPVQAPAQTAAAQVPAYRSQQEERQAELEALRRGSRAHSSASGSRGATPTIPSPSSRAGFHAPTEPSASVSQADQTKSELDMLRSRRLLNSGLDASSGASESNAASERKAELDAIRRARGGSQTALNAAPTSPPVHSWNQRQEQDQQKQLQQQREEDARRQREEDQKRQREEDQRRQQQLQQREADERRQREADQRRQLEQERQAEAERQRAPPAGAQQSREPRARAVYDYDAQDADELSFKDGEIIYSVDQLDPGWWAGESEDGLRRGVFPSNFDLGANHAVALFDYEAAEDGELSFKEGDQITHIDLVSGDWWEGVNAGTGAQGLFPANHVELV